MKYIKGFNYQLAENETLQTKIHGYSVNDDYYSLDHSGLLVAEKGFAWDGCSGSIDTDTNMRGGLFHDIGCLMVARKQLPLICIGQVNKMFHDLLIEDSMMRIRAGWHYAAVEHHFAGNRKPARRKVIVLNKPDRRSYA